MSTTSRLYEEAVDRAKSKASILQRLSQNYGKNQQQKKIHKSTEDDTLRTEAQKINSIIPTTTTKKRPLTDEGNSSTLKHKLEKKLKGLDTMHFNDVVDRSIQLLMKVSETSSDRSREYLKESLTNKSLIIESTPRSATKIKSLQRVQRQQKRRHKLSARKMKQQRLLLLHSNDCVSFDEVSLLHGVFQRYLHQLSFLQQNQSQSMLQTRLSTIELIGAEIYILETSVRYRNLAGMSGIIVCKAANLYSICITSTGNAHQQKGIKAIIPIRNFPKRPGDGEFNADNTIIQKREDECASYSLIKVPSEEITFLILLPNDVLGANWEKGFPTQGMKEFINSISDSTSSSHSLHNSQQQQLQVVEILNERNPQANHISLSNVAADSALQTLKLRNERIIVYRGKNLKSVKMEGSK